MCKDLLFDTCILTGSGNRLLCPSCTKFICRQVFREFLPLPGRFGNYARLGAAFHPWNKNISQILILFLQRFIRKIKKLTIIVWCFSQSNKCDKILCAFQSSSKKTKTDQLSNNKFYWNDAEMLEGEIQYMDFS